jgi:rubrerythrin
MAENDEQKKAPEAGQAETQPEQPRVWKCGRCKCDLVTKKVELDYMGYSISHELPACPKCGKVYISKELAEGRMCEVEQTLEDK